MLSTLINSVTRWFCLTLLLRFLCFVLFVLLISFWRSQHSHDWWWLHCCRLACPPPWEDDPRVGTLTMIQSQIHLASPTSTNPKWLAMTPGSPHRPHPSQLSLAAQYPVARTQCFHGNRKELSGDDPKIADMQSVWDTGADEQPAHLQGPTKQKTERAGESTSARNSYSRVEKGATLKNINIRQCSTAFSAMLQATIKQTRERTVNTPKSVCDTTKSTLAELLVED